MDEAREPFPDLDWETVFKVEIVRALLNVNDVSS